MVSKKIQQDGYESKSERINERQQNTYGLKQ